MDLIHVEKYYPQIKERFPDLSEKQIDKIVKYGLKSFYLYTRSGADMLVRSNFFVAYFGHWFKSPKLMGGYRKLKWTIKYRIMYSREKIKFNGLYYFVGDQDLYDRLYGPKGKRNKTARKLRFNELYIYKIYEEATLQNKEYIFEFSYPEDLGYRYKLRDVTIANASCVSKRCRKRKYEFVSTNTKNETRKNQLVKRRT